VEGELGVFVGDKEATEVTRYKFHGVFDDW